MKALFTAIMVIALVSNIFGFAGHITVNTTWDEDIVITGDTWIDPGVTLTIMPGVTVSFPKVDQNQDGIGDTDFIIQGRLLCQGMADNRVAFTSLEDDPQPSDWGGFDYTTAEQYELSTISNTDIFYAHQAFYINGRNVTFNGCHTAYAGDYGLRIESTIFTTSINNCLIEESQTYGLLVEEGTVTINSSTIYNNGYYGVKIIDNVNFTADDFIVSTNDDEGIWIVNNTQATFTDSRSISNSKNGALIDNASPSFNNCSISNNAFGGILVTGINACPSFTYCTISDNDESGLYFYDECQGNVSNSEITQNGGSGIYVSYSYPTVNYNNIYDNFGEDPDNAFVEYIINKDWNDYSEVFGEFDWRCEGVESVYHPILEDWYPRIIKTLTYKKDGDYYYDNHSHNYQNYTNILANGTTYLSDTYFFWCPEGHDMPELTISGQINEAELNPYDIELNLYDNTNCPGARAWVESYTYCSALAFNEYIQTLVFNETGTSVNFQNNWWGQIVGVNELIYQAFPGTIAYEILETAAVPDAGATLDNIIPDICLITPSTMLINPEDVTITWTDIDVDNDAMISLYFDDGLDETGTLISGNISEDDETDSYLWDLSDITYGTYYIYGVIDDGINEAVVSYAPGRVMVGPLIVRAPDNGSGVAGTEAIVSVRVINAIDYFDLLSYQFTLTFNPTIIEATDISTEGTLSEDWTVFCNTNTPGQISVNGFSTESLEGTDTLINIIFNVNAGAANYATSNLNFADFVFNEGEPEATIEDGLFTVINQYNITGNVQYYHEDNENVMSGVELIMTGDDEMSTFSGETGYYEFPSVLAGDYVVTPSFDDAIPEMIITPYDASLTAQFALSLYAFTTNQQIAADVTGDGNATAYDAAFMAQYAVGLIDEFPAGRWIFDPGYIEYSLTNNFEGQIYQGIAIGDPSGNWVPGEIRNNDNLDYISFDNIPENYEGELTLSFTYEAPFYSILSKLSYDSEILEFIRINENPVIDGFEIQINDTGEELYVGGYSLDNVQSEETILSVTFSTVSPFVNSNAIVLDYILFDENWGTNYRMNLDEGEGEYDEKANFALLNSYPNPCRSEVEISFSIADESDIELEIYNIKGQKVKAHSVESRGAGIFSKTINTSELPSGLYFYKLSSKNGLSDIKKMIILK